MEKFCNGCNQIKTTDEFNRDKSKKDGLCTRCKQCVKEYKIKNSSNIVEYQRKYNKIYRQENKKRISNTDKIYRDKNKGVLSTKKKIYNSSRKEEKKEYDRLYREKNIERIKRRQQVYALDNKEKIKSYRKNYYINNKEMLSDKSKNYRKNNKDKKTNTDKMYRNSPAKYITTYNSLTIEESPKLAEDGVSLEVKCRYCGKYFKPTNRSVHDRIYSLLNNYYESALYCSDNCKDACPIFNQKKFPKGFKPASSREVNPLIRQMCFERDDWKCQICGATQTEAPLHCHHIEGYAQNPLLGNDIDNVITLCKKCHKEVHKLPECNYYELRCKKE